MKELNCVRCEARIPDGDKCIFDHIGIFCSKCCRGLRELISSYVTGQICEDDGSYAKKYHRGPDEH